MMMNRQNYLMTFEYKVWRTMLDVEDVYNSMIPTKKYRCGEIAKESKNMTTQYVSAVMKRLVTMGLVKKEKVKTGRIIELTTETRVVRDPVTGWYKEVEMLREQPVRIEETITYFEKI